MRPSIALLMVLVLSAAGCAGPTTPSDVVPQGVWGGDGIKMTVTATGATLEFDCDAGAISEPLLFAHVGKFTASGTYSFGRGGPRQQGDPPAPQHPARYEGSIDGKEMQLSIFLSDLSRNMGAFMLELGRQPTLERCL
jgi:hypothetical protein